MIWGLLLTAGAWGWPVELSAIPAIERVPSQTDLTPREDSGALLSPPHTQTLTAPRPEGPPASGHHHSRWASLSPAPRSSSGHMEPSVPCEKRGQGFGPAAGQQAKKGARIVLHCFLGTTCRDSPLSWAVARMLRSWAAAGAAERGGRRGGVGGDTLADGGGGISPRPSGEGLSLPGVTSGRQCAWALENSGRPALKLSSECPPGQWSLQRRGVKIPRGDASGGWSPRT